MERHETEELVIATLRLAEKAEAFVNRAPRQKRMDAERSALLDAISHAQLVLSVHRISNNRENRHSRPAQSRKHRVDCGKQLQRTKEKAKQLELRLEAMTIERATFQERVGKAKGLLETATKQPARVIPLKRNR